MDFVLNGPSIHNSRGNGDSNEVPYTPNPSHLNGELG